MQKNLHFQPYIPYNSHHHIFVDRRPTLIIDKIWLRFDVRFADWRTLMTDQRIPAPIFGESIIFLFRMLWLVGCSSFLRSFRLRFLTRRRRRLRQLSRRCRREHIWTEREKSLWPNRAHLDENTNTFANNNLAGRWLFAVFCFFRCRFNGQWNVVRCAMCVIRMCLSDFRVLFFVKCQNARAHNSMDTSEVEAKTLVVIFDVLTTLHLIMYKLFGTYLQ